MGDGGEISLEFCFVGNRRSEYRDRVVLGYFSDVNL